MHFIQFIADGKVDPALNQLTAFLNKVEQDYQQGLLTVEEYNYLVSAGDSLIAALTGN